MGNQATQRKAHRFFSERMATLEPFTKQDLMKASGWPENTLETYWSKQFRGLVEDIGGGKFRLREQFRSYLDWRKFHFLVTQVRTPPTVYEPTVYTKIIVYEFYLPLSHENSLRFTLDSLFFKNSIIPRLKRAGIPALENLFPRTLTESDADLVERVCEFVGTKFQGYSIYHVNGRFRSGELTDEDGAAALRKQAIPYLIDETTAVTRFVFPCADDEIEKVRFLFKELFVETITQQISGEDEVWMVESGLQNCVHVWKPKQENG
jgi:hypothetical protein